jgi:hypothetical protein
MALLACAALARGQGQVQFNNRVTSGTLGLAVAPIFGPEPNDPETSAKPAPQAELR